MVFGMKILVINAGSSSIKYQLIDMATEKVIAKGMCDRIGIAGGNFKLKADGREDYKVDIQMANHKEAVKLVLDALVSPEHGVIESLSEISAVGHRVLHGGEKFSGSVIVNEDVIAAIEECCELGPLHNPHNLTGIRACEAMMPGVPQVAVFDTGFHQTMPDYAYMYALPYEMYDKYAIRRYGFHGTSHRYVSARVCEFLKMPVAGTRIVTAHIGNGGSCCAVYDGHSIDTSMGLTPVEGLMMGTRCGDLDAGAATYIMEKEHLTPAEFSAVINKKSGLLGVSGVSSDARDITAAIKNGNKKAELARQMFIYRIRKYIGAYAAAMNGLDVLVFTGGIGENDTYIREQICKGLTYLGVDVDYELASQVHGEEKMISTAQSKIKVCVIPTDEEIMIAKDTVALL